MKAIYKREVASYFKSMTGYVFLFFVFLIVGIYFYAYNPIPFNLPFTARNKP